MIDKFQQLQDRLEKVLTVMEMLRKENNSLKSESLQLKGELGKIRQEFARLQRKQNDQTEAVRTRLAAALAQVEELESITE